jgi:hypothetical protein
MPKTVSKARFLKGPAASRRLKTIAAAKARTMKARASMRKSKIATLKSCPKGMKMRVPTMRKAYTKKSGSKVSRTIIKPTCIRKRGKSSGKKLIVLDPEDHYLSEYGYHNLTELTPKERMNVLMKLAEHFVPIKGKTATWTYIIRALNARYVLNRNTNPKVARIMKADRNKISAMYKKIKN